MFYRWIPIALVAGFAVYGWLVPIAKCQSADPEGTIREFSRALSEKDLRLLATLLTNEPEYVARAASTEAFKKYPGRRVGREPGNSDSVQISPSVPARAGTELVTHVVPTSLFFDQNRTVTEINKLRMSGDEAVANVKLGGYDLRTGKDLAPLMYDVLLYRQDGKWKIFKLIARRRGDEGRYIYSFFAKSEVAV